MAKKIIQPSSEEEVDTNDSAMQEENAGSNSSGKFGGNTTGAGTTGNTGDEDVSMTGTDPPLGNDQASNAQGNATPDDTAQTSTNPTTQTSPAAPNSTAPPTSTSQTGTAPIGTVLVGTAPTGTTPASVGQTDIAPISTAPPASTGQTGTASMGTVPVGTAPTDTAPASTGQAGIAQVGTAPSTSIGQTGTAPIDTAPTGTAQIGGDNGGDGGDGGGDGGGGPDPIGSPPKNPPDRIPGNDFAGPYRSKFTNTIEGDAKHGIMDCLTNVNCSYLSTPGFPPTLRELKQHAQALTILIKHVSVSTSSALIDNMNSEMPQAGRFDDGETYDWLNNLAVRYNGPENTNFLTHHNMPLTSILNTLLPQPDIYGRDDICPLYSTPKIPPNAKSLPYATHEALINHANDLLELIDHEYSAKGGLLSILPPANQKEDRKKAESTLLGQFVLYVNNLVERLHDLERLYANSMDALAGEAVVPFQALSRLGPDGRKGREMVYPQDRFVLVNAGEDVWQFLNTEFQRKEYTDDKVAEMYKKQGVTGEDIWRRRGGKEYSRGITTIDVVTRYYRLRKDPLKTIFVIPAYAEHPGTKVTREIERQQTVVSVVKPIWPERQSQLEMKHRADLEAFRKLKIDYMRVEHDLDIKTQAEKVLKYDNDQNTVRIQQLQEQIARYEAAHALAHQATNANAADGAPAVTAAQAAEARIATLDQQLTDCQRRHTDAEAARTTAAAELAAERIALEAERVAFYADRERWRAQQIADTDRLTAEFQSHTAALAQANATQGAQAQDLQHRLADLHTQQLQRTLTLQEILRRAAMTINFADVDIPTDIRERANGDAAALVDELVTLHEARYPNQNATPQGREPQVNAPQQAVPAAGEAGGLGWRRGVRFVDVEDDDEIMEYEEEESASLNSSDM